MIDSESHYGASYLSHERWMSYVHQVTAIADLNPARVAEIGVGPGVVGDMVRTTYPGCDYVSVDIDPTLRPQVCASVVDLPFADASFDATFCCQVLEHLPYDLFRPALAELRRITRCRVVISLPDVSPFFFLRARGSRRLLPGLWNGFSLPSVRQPVHDFAIHGQHHWEIGVRGYPLRCILADIKQAGFTQPQHFRMVERSYWHFFLLDVPQ